MLPFASQAVNNSSKTDISIFVPEEYINSVIYFDLVSTKEHTPVLRCAHHKGEGEEVLELYVHGEGNITRIGINSYKISNFNRRIDLRCFLKCSSTCKNMLTGRLNDDMSFMLELRRQTDDAMLRKEISFMATTHPAGQYNLKGFGVWSFDFDVNKEFINNMTKEQEEELKAEWNKKLQEILDINLK